MWYSTPRWWHDGDHCLQWCGSKHHWKLWNARQRSETGEDFCSVLNSRQSDHQSGEELKKLREHLDRHSRHRQVLKGDFSWSIHPLQHHLLVHLLLTHPGLDCQDWSGRNYWRLQHCKGAISVYKKLPTRMKKVSLNQLNFFFLIVELSQPFESLWWSALK